MGASRDSGPDRRVTPFILPDLIWTVTSGIGVSRGLFPVTARRYHASIRRPRLPPGKGLIYSESRAATPNHALNRTLATPVACDTLKSPRRNHGMTIHLPAEL